MGWLQRTGPDSADGNFDAGSFCWPGAWLAPLRQSIAQTRRSGRARKGGAADLERTAQPAIRGRALWRDGDCVLCMVGARGRLARSPRVGRDGCRGHGLVLAVGQVESLS